MHVTLVGDSIFDNKLYSTGGPDVSAHLRATLGTESSVTCLAVDGSVTVEVATQLEGVPAASTHLIVSSGGNDALGFSAYLQEPARTVLDVMHKFHEFREIFQESYSDLMREVLKFDGKVALCTVYNPRFPEAGKQRAAEAALCLFNDVIIRIAAQHSLPVIDLRAVMNEESDYVYSIEPSCSGGSKISRAIADYLLGQSKQASVLYG